MEMLMAQSVHLSMYISLAMIAVTGLVIGGMYWSGIKDGTEMHIALVAHEFFVQTSYLLIFLHISAAVYHRRKGDGIWSAMVPYFWRESSVESDRTKENSKVFLLAALILYGATWSRATFITNALVRNG
jgi:cytochrome b subunit of formate dehydrogenase